MNNKNFEDKTDNKKNIGINSIGNIIINHGKLFDIEIDKDESGKYVYIHSIPVHLHYDLEMYKKNPVRYISEQERHSSMYLSELRNLINEKESRLETLINRESKIELAYYSNPNGAKIEAIIANAITLPFSILFTGKTPKQIFEESIEKSSEYIKGYEIAKEAIDLGIKIINKIFEYDKCDNNLFLKSICNDIDRIKSNNEEISYAYLRLIRTSTNIMNSEKIILNSYYK